MDILLLLAAGKQIMGYSGCGDFMMNSNGQLIRRSEKAVSPFVYTGVALISPKIFNGTPSGPFSLNMLFDRAIKLQRLYGIRLDGDWYHVGTPDSVGEAEQKMRLNNY